MPLKEIGSAGTVRINPLNLDILQPNPDTVHETSKGLKTFVIGKPGTGKSNLIAHLAWAKSFAYPVARVFSGTEEENHFYRNIGFPDTMIHDELTEDDLWQGIRRQKHATKYLKNPRCLEIYDDVMDDPRVFKTKAMRKIMKNGRHHDAWYIFALQYGMDVDPSTRAAVDGTFLLREPSLKIRKTLYENYAGIIPSFDLFQDVMDVITDDYTALYIHAAVQENDWTKCVFYHKPPVVRPFRFGCADYWAFHEDRYNENYQSVINF